MINERLQSTLKGHRLIVNVTPVLVFPLIVIMISCCFIGQDVLGVLIGIGGSLAAAFLHFSAKERIKSILSDNISGIVVKETFGDPAEYDPDGRVTPGPMEFPFYYNAVSGENLIRTVYNGLKIELSDVELKNDAAKTTLFLGQWLICDFGRELSGEVFISANATSGEPCLEGAVKMNNKAFDDRFCVKTWASEEAGSILTPHLMDLILKMADRANGQVYLSFLRSGKAHIAVNNGHSIFALGEAKVDHETLHQRYVSELKWFTDMIDMLRTEDTLFKKETSV